ncbi:hypothetical protein CEXT_764251 [Caerostris extrusa]|uniref:Uncharacterized protein n=1 Tax=Caerostris extrusa TaxID=172846 RepID=A0AAV4X5W1_CAEEX|nr:hypothetical protein CEXT_764251 [Caerostris extrusa]
MGLRQYAPIAECLLTPNEKKGLISGSSVLSVYKRSYGDFKGVDSWTPAECLPCSGSGSRYMRLRLMERSGQLRLIGGVTIGARVAAWLPSTITGLECHQG